MGRVGCSVFIALMAWSGSIQAAPDSLTAARVIEIARSRSPDVLLERTRIEEARGRYDAAGALHTENPTLEAVANTDDRFERRTEWELTVPVDPGWTRIARRRVARAELRRAEHQASVTTQRSIGAALQAFYRALHARDLLELAGRRLSVADRVRSAAEERHRSGDAARMDVLLAQSERARAASDLRAREQEQARASTSLALVLALPSGAEHAVAGDLADRSATESPPDRAPYRPDVLAAKGELSASTGERDLARTLALPHIAFRLDYGHESGIATARPGVALTIPIFNAGYGERVSARARRERAQIELQTRQASAQAEIAGFRAAYAAAQASVEELARGGIPQSREVAAMAEDAYRGGKMSLVGLLQVQREILETEREYVDRLLEAALAAVDLGVANGLWR